MAHAAHVPVWFEPVSVPKSVRASGVLNCIMYISPNAHELIAMAVAVEPRHNREAANRLLLQIAAGSPFLMSVLKVSESVLSAQQQSTRCFVALH